MELSQRRPTLVRVLATAALLGAFVGAALGQLGNSGNFTIGTVAIAVAGVGVTGIAVTRIATRIESLLTG